MKIHHPSPLTADHGPTQSLYEAIVAIRNTEEARMFLQDLCTPAEIQAMADRWRVVPLLKAEKPYRQIHEETGVSVTTIGRVARCIMLGQNGYNLIFKRLKNKMIKHDE